MDLKKENSLLKRIINSIPAHIYWKNLSGEHLGCNKLNANAANLDSPEDIVGKTDYELSWKDKADEIIASDKKVIASLSEVEAEESSVFPGNDYETTMLSRKMPLYDDDGEIMGIIGVSLDITELKKTQSQLAEALEQAKCAEKERERLLARYKSFVLNQEHDVRTPIAGVQGLAEALVDMLDDPDCIELAQHLLQSATAQRAYQETLLDGIYLFNEESELYRRRFSLKEILKRVVDMYECSFKDNDITSHLDVAQDVPDMLFGDWFRLQKCLVAVMSNAVKFTDEGGKIAMRAKLVSRKDRDIVLAFEIEDTGEGMAADSLDTIFEPFERLTLSNIGKYEGRGLGLTFVKQMVEDLGGEIEVRSELGKGSLFRLLIPYQCSLSDGELPALSLS